MRKLTSILIPGLLLAACAATPYQPTNVNGYGYTEQQVSADDYTVAFVANTATSMQQVHDYALLRAAEIGAAQGYGYLTVEQDKSGSIMLAPYRPGGSNYGTPNDNSANMTGRDMGMMGMSSSYGGGGNSYGGGSYSMGSPSPGSSPARACALRLHFSKQPDAEGGKTPQDIQALLAKLRAQYTIPASGG